jgi:hypothetical protein
MMLTFAAWSLIVMSMTAIAITFVRQRPTRWDGEFLPPGLVAFRLALWVPWLLLGLDAAGVV